MRKVNESRVYHVAVYVLQYYRVFIALETHECVRNVVSNTQGGCAQLSDTTGPVISDQGIDCGNMSLPYIPIASESSKAT